MAVHSRIYIYYMLCIVGDVIDDALSTASEPAFALRVEETFVRKLVPMMRLAVYIPLHSWYDTALELLAV